MSRNYLATALVTCSMVMLGALMVMPMMSHSFLWSGIPYRVVTVAAVASSVVAVACYVKEKLCAKHSR